MPNTIEHERMRFNTMSLGQLVTRLHKITDRDKLLNFIAVCGEYMQTHFNKATGKPNYSDLRQAAVERFNELFWSNSGTSSLSGSIGTSSIGASGAITPPIVIPQSNISSNLKRKKHIIPKYREQQEKKSELSKPIDIAIDIADVIYMKRKLRLE